MKRYRVLENSVLVVTKLAIKPSCDVVKASSRTSQSHERCYPHIVAQSLTSAPLSATC